MEVTMQPCETERSLAQVERDYILEMLTRCNGNRTRAARILGISVRGLRGKLRAYERDGVRVISPHPVSYNPRALSWRWLG